MIKTGFYDIALRKEGERKAEREKDNERRRQRMLELKLIGDKKDEQN